MSTPRTPLALAIAVAAGLALAPLLDRAGAPLGPRWLVAIVVGGAAWWRRDLLLVAGVALGLARGAVPTLPALTRADPDRVVGTVRGPIVHTARGDGARLEVDAGDGGRGLPSADSAAEGPRGVVDLWLWTEAHLAPGDRVAATGRVRVPRGLRNPATPDRRDLVRARGAERELTARTLEHLGTDDDLASRVWRWADATQRAWGSEIAATSDRGGPALAGIVIGERRALSTALDERWRVAGIFHVLSVSGLHLAVVAGLAFTALRRLLAASPWGGRVRPARLAALPALGLAIAYTLVTGAQLATLRALLAIGLALVGEFLDRPLRALDAIGVAALAILAWRPADLFDPSFQLSFVAALTLALRTAPSTTRGVRGWIVRGATTSAWVALTTAPLTAYHFQQVALGGIVGNLVLTPPLELVALPLGLAGAALHVAPFLALAAWLVDLADRGAALLAVVAPTGHIAVASTTMLAALVVLSLLAAHGRARRAVWLALCFAWALGRTPPAPGALRITFLDVGQGDAALVELPDGATWLIDAGGAPNAADLARASSTGGAIDRVLAAYGRARIDRAILSHPHPDHYLGLAGIAAPIDELWIADESAGNDRKHDLVPYPASTPARSLPGFTAIAAALAARGTRILHPALGVSRHGDVELEVLAPRYRPDDGPPRCATDPVRSVNDNSLVVLLRYRGRRVLFAGDIEAEGEDALAALGVDLSGIDIVKVPHHGSPTSSTEALVAATRPRLAVISCGANNAFGFPSPAVVARWRAAGAEVARTDVDGAITATIDSAGALAVGARP